jgi:hypothetical protein
VSPVHAAQADEGSAKVVLATSPQPEARQVLVEALEHVIHVPMAAQTRGHDQVVGLRLPSHQFTPAPTPPGRKEACQRLVNGHLSGPLGLHLFLDPQLHVEGGVDRESPEGLRILIVVTPTASGRLAETKSPCEEDEAVPAYGSFSKL